VGRRRVAVTRLADQRVHLLAEGQPMYPLTKQLASVEYHIERAG
jgi:hypothetical protein